MSKKDELIKLNDQLCKMLPGSREQMIVANMELVKWNVNNFLKVFPTFCHLEDDLVSEGYLGLVQAVDRIIRGQPREDKPTAFLTIYIQEAFATCVQNEELVQIPRRTRNHHKIPPAKSISIEAAGLDKVAVTPSNDWEVEDSVLGCCDCDVEREIISLRAAGHSDSKIGEILDLSHYTVYMTRREIYGRFLARNPEIRGEV